MILILSGEGPTDLGTCNNAQVECSEDFFSIGPMGVLVDKIIEPLLGYSLRTFPGSIRFISKAKLKLLADERKKSKRSMVLRGKYHDHETSYYYVNCWDLGLASLKVEAEGDKVVSVFFRDCDRMRSDPPLIWKSKFKSVKDGFSRAGFGRGVPMIANPKSEAWLLCCAKDQPFQHCAILENISGNDDAPHPAKAQLADALGGEKNANELSAWLDGVEFDVQGASAMPSFAAFSERLHDVIRDVLADR
ncbi:hypothetical protein GJ698_14415 [Pseudoduganella sp. FT26W]|uniref:Uncharacterized protein n=1 Tax=Duganella aquatilis TaxID=2666082 RepID=A0A844D606_9BURK|nr:hypothetical protein [Duganella aquatilis]MRW85275.1 hypothetical protein [Duganella aquatilis]